MSLHRFGHSSLPLALIIFAGFGCGGGTNDIPAVNGKVTYDGKPAANVQIKLTATDGTAYTGVTQPDGSFSVMNVKDGEMAVTFEPAQDPNAYMMEEFKKHKSSGEATKAAPPSKSNFVATPLPAKYKDAATSGQKWTVDKNNRTKNFDLTK